MSAVAATSEFVWVRREPRWALSCIFVARRDLKVILGPLNRNALGTRRFDSGEFGRCVAIPIPPLVVAAMQPIGPPRKKASVVYTNDFAAPVKPRLRDMVNLFGA